MKLMKYLIILLSICTYKVLYSAPPAWVGSTLQQLNPQLTTAQINAVLASMAGVNLPNANWQIWINQYTVQQKQKFNETYSKALKKYITLPFGTSQISAAINSVFTDELFKKNPLSGKNYLTTSISADGKINAGSSVVYGYTDDIYSVYYLPNADEPVCLMKMESNSLPVYGYPISQTSPLQKSTDFVLISDSTDEPLIHSAYTLENLDSVFLKTFSNKLPSISFNKGYVAQNVINGMKKSTIFCLEDQKITRVYQIDEIDKPANSLTDLSAGLSFSSVDSDSDLMDSATDIEDSSQKVIFLSPKGSNQAVYQYNIKNNVCTLFAYSTEGYTAGLPEDSLMLYSLITTDTSSSQMLVQVRAYADRDLALVGNVMNKLSDGNYVVSMINIANQSASMFLVVDPKGVCVASWQVTRQVSKDVSSDKLILKQLIPASGTSKYTATLDVSGPQPKFNISIGGQSSGGQSLSHETKAASFSQTNVMKQADVAEDYGISLEKFTFAEFTKRMSNYVMKNSYSPQPGITYALF